MHAEHLVNEQGRIPCQSTFLGKVPLSRDLGSRDKLIYDLLYLNTEFLESSSDEFFHHRRQIFRLDDSSLGASEETARSGDDLVLNLGELWKDVIIIHCCGEVAALANNAREVGDAAAIPSEKLSLVSDVAGLLFM